MSSHSHPAAKPCPFCGGAKVSTHEGSTFRWVYAACDECGAQAGEVRKQTLGEGNPEEWHQEVVRSAIAEWNRRAPQQDGPSDRSAVLEESARYAIHTLNWLNIQGGLGHDKHERILEALEKLDRALKNAAPQEADAVQEGRSQPPAGAAPSEAGADDVTDYRAKYHSLLFAVGNKYPGETRHQTALRYILQAERGSNTPEQAKQDATEGGVKNG